ncbi:GNAT family N-acetyltransferase [Amycolatopsis sp. NBC_00345]|uniref:GNAT family N-acetyltransferase n=1 Tax=Amycolatopsis sp. NBC_00345 TaxID=2975955 RepID=UPI002E25C123
MAGDPLLTRARRVWLEQAGAPVAFPAEGGAHVVVSAGSLLCPPGWVGIVSVGDAAIVTVPAPGLLDVMREAGAGLPAAALTDPDRLRRAVPVAEVLGPGTLDYCDERTFQPTTPNATETIPPGHRDLATLLASVPAGDAEQCGLAEITSPAFVVRNGTRVVAAAGYQHWPGQAAHVCVLTVPDQRGRGLARVVAGAATADGLANRLLPQWRAGHEASRRVAWALGFRRLGVQLSVRIEG